MLSADPGNKVSPPKSSTRLAHRTVLELLDSGQQVWRMSNLLWGYKEQISLSAKDIENYAANGPFWRLKYFLLYYL